MICKQCVYVGKDKVTHSGIHCIETNGDNYIICLCCGGLVDPAEVQFKELENWESIASYDVECLRDTTEKQLAKLRYIEELTQQYLKEYGELEIAFPLQKTKVTNTEYVEFNPVWN